MRIFIYRSLTGRYPDFVIEGLKNPESERINADLIIALIKHICQTSGSGAILVFVPGWEEINAILRKMNEESSFFNCEFSLLFRYSRVISFLTTRHSCQQLHS